MPETWTLGVLCDLADGELRELIRDLDLRILAPRTQRPEAVAETVRAAELLVCGIGPMLPAGRDIAEAPRLAFGQKLGSGVNGYDLAAFDSAGVPFSNMPGATAPAIAEWCLGAALALSRRLLVVDAAIRSGGWPHQQLRSMGAQELRSQRIGVVGMGAIGQDCARLFRAIGCTVGYSNRTRRPALEESLGLEYLTLDELCRQSDVLVVALALNAETEGLLNGRRLRLLPQGSYLVNATRGRILDEQVLIELLAEGHLAGAALDVFHTEPLPADSALRQLPNVLLFPHSSADSPQTRQRLFRLANDNLRRAVAETDVHWVVNRAPAAVRRRTAGARELDATLVHEVRL
ncbi:MAG TPA: D-isomer specific 2-hydroxyacid dehydrogenase family protein [Nakamurella sp.]|nr:D-isomer specific 2-hydroxyacid dehydrogenase family protein [Nakamurella sp.]